MRILLCMPKFIGPYLPGSNGGGAWGWNLERQFKRMGWDVTFVHSFEDELVPEDIARNQDIIFFRHSYQTRFKRYHDIISKCDLRNTLIVQNYMEDDADTGWKSFKECFESDVWLAQSKDQVEVAHSANFASAILHYPLDMNVMPSEPRLTKNLLYVGRLCPYKGTDSLLSAFKLIREKHPDATLTIRGEWSWGDWGDPDAQGFKDYIKSNERIIESIGNINLVTGWDSPDKVYEYYKKCSILLFPVSGEGYGGPIVEAHASAMPVIASGKSSQQEKILSGGDGYFLDNTWVDPFLGKFKVPDPVGIANIVDALFNDMSLIFAIGKAGRKKAETEYNQDIVIPNLIEWLLDMLKHKRRHIIAV